ncbi:SDR family oxidoreductase [soil metagenome]
MSKPLSGKVALVTGGSRGIGAATTRALSAAGATVAFSYSSSSEKAEALAAEILAAGHEAVAFYADQGDPKQVGELVRAVADRFGRLDILVNNAGALILGQIDADDRDQDSVDRVVDLNVRGVATAVSAAAKVMGDGGRVISIGSSAADRVSFAGMGDYAATKAAVAAYTRGWARDLGKRNITVNVIQPGPINTDMNPESGPFSEAVRSATALGRFGQPHEVAAAVVFLASPEASFITSSTVNVDGGINA